MTWAPPCLACVTKGSADHMASILQPCDAGSMLGKYISMSMNLVTSTPGLSQAALIETSPMLFSVLTAIVLFSRSLHWLIEVLVARMAHGSLFVSEPVCTPWETIF